LLLHKLGVLGLDLCLQLLLLVLVITIILEA
jgi:hypothetical protein